MKQIFQRMTPINTAFRITVPASASFTQPQSKHCGLHDINPLAPELFFLILAQPVHKMWIIQEPNKLALWNKLHFKEKKTDSIEHV